MRWFSLFFKLSANERRGYLLLLALCGLTLLIPVLYRALEGKSPPDMHTLEILTTNPASESSATSSATPIKEAPVRTQKPKQAAQLFYFNPNQLPVAQWRLLGFSDQQIQVIKNYEAKGGFFKQSSDLAKIYSISATEFQRIAPYLLFEAPSPKASINKSIATGRQSSNSKPSILVDINQADSLQFISLKGIGPVYTSRILKYRESLGGFHQLEQLKEVYGISAALYESLTPSLFLTASPELRKIPINTVLATELAKHPYFNKKNSQTLVNYRTQHGLFKNIEDLNIIYAFDEYFLRKIEPYLSFN